MVICLEQGADLHMAQLMPLPLSVSCFSKIYIGFTFLVVAYPGSPGKGPLNGCVCDWSVERRLGYPGSSSVVLFFTVCRYLVSACTYHDAVISSCIHMTHVDDTVTDCHQLSAATVSEPASLLQWSPFVVGRWQDYVGCSGSTAIYGHDAVAMLWINVAYCVKLSGRDLSYYTTTTTAVSWPLYRSTCIIRHLQSRTGGFCWCKVLLPTCPC